VTAVNGRPEPRALGELTNPAGSGVDAQGIDEPDRTASMLEGMSLSNENVTLTVQ
jgi:hypothetical protein